MSWYVTEMRFWFISIQILDTVTLWILIGMFASLLIVAIFTELLRKCVHVLQVTIKACLTLTELCKMEQSLDVIFEEPFCLTTQFATASDSYQLLSPQDCATAETSGTLSSSSSVSQGSNVPANELIHLSAFLESVARCRLEISSVELRAPSSAAVQVGSAVILYIPSILS